MSTDTDVLRVELRGCPPSLNKFAGRENCWEYRKSKQTWTEAVIYSVRALRGRPREPFAFAEVEIVYYFPTRTRHDADNYAGKFLIDGLTKAGVIEDDDFRHIRLSVAGQVDRKNSRTVITVRRALP